MTEFFGAFIGLVIFLHIISAIVWLGGMIAIRFAVHYSIQEIEDEKIKLDKTLELLRRFFNMVIPSIILLIITAVIMSLSFGFKGTELSLIVHIKELIWTIMTILFITIYIKRNRANRLFNDGDLKGAKETLSPISIWMIPLNIAFGIIALYFGVTLRGF